MALSSSSNSSDSSSHSSSSSSRESGLGTTDSGTAGQTILWVQDIKEQAVGGKALGLRKLMQWGLNVPPAFVLVNAEVGNHPDDLAAFYQQMGEGKVAVRSSAIGEDGDDSSFAGLYETILNVEGLPALTLAIDQCVQSLNSLRASAYQEDQHIDTSQMCVQMCVVVQRMVDANSAGVLFTVDPVSGRHDRLVIDAVTGLGEALVSGEQTPDHYEYDRAGQLVYSELLDKQAILSDAQQQQLILQARQAENGAGDALDMEWAIDAKGDLYWLQARPVTTIGSDLNELDTPLKADDVLTRCNVGEMMPGASCPLTFSTTGRGIEHGMQHMHVSYASRPEITEEWTQLAMSHGKLFLNLSGAAAAAATVLGIDVKSLGHSVCGGIVEGLKDPAKKAWWIRLGGSIKLLRYLRNADSVISEFTQRAEHFCLPTAGDSRSMTTALEQAQPFLYEAMAVHLQSSTTSGFASNILQGIISGGQESTPEEEAEAANLMAGATGVESAVLVEQLDQVVEQISGHEDVKEKFLNTTSAEALTWLNSEASDKNAKTFQTFLQRHGHRGYRELCMRETGWADAPEDLVKTMQASVNAYISGVVASTKPDGVELESLSRALRWILPKAHNAVRRREATKSLLVSITNRFKQSYRALGFQLESEGLLDDADLVFFFTQKELCHYVLQRSTGNDSIVAWNKKAKKRRIALEFQNRLNFDEISVGLPKPIDVRGLVSATDGDLVGRPVSLGIVEATARVALSVSEAAALQPGEILVAPITDVGWTPYFSMISGLITDVGSAVSHGAVIAREYGLPAIVNTRVGTQRIKTGDRIRLDANTGKVTIL
ncbi:MAG: pyruvate, water dikinase [Pseudomonadales bacterium]|nr:pyruvate, water dikinase [Pseudomonadales bacterium]